MRNSHHVRYTRSVSYAYLLPELDDDVSVPGSSKARCGPKRWTARRTNPSSARGSVGCECFQRLAGLRSPSRRRQHEKQREEWRAMKQTPLIGTVSAIALAFIAAVGLGSPADAAAKCIKGDRKPPYTIGWAHIYSV